MSALSYYIERAISEGGVVRSELPAPISLPNNLVIDLLALDTSLNEMLASVPGDSQERSLVLRLQAAIFHDALRWPSLDAESRRALEQRLYQLRPELEYPNPELAVYINAARPRR